MAPKIIIGQPPNFRQIVAAFPKAEGADTIFAYEPCIYVSSELIVLPPQLIKHETIHIRRQKEIGVEEWWRKYIEDEKFRYNEELLAHRAEYWVATRGISDMKERKRILTMISRRMNSPLYKFSTTAGEIARDIHAI